MCGQSAESGYRYWRRGVSGPLVGWGNYLYGSPGGSLVAVPPGDAPASSGKQKRSKGEPPANGKRQAKAASAILCVHEGSQLSRHYARYTRRIARYASTTYRGIRGCAIAPLRPRRLASRRRNAMAQRCGVVLRPGFGPVDRGPDFAGRVNMANNWICYCSAGFMGAGYTLDT